MTREEAINLVKQVLPCLNVDEKIREGFKTLIPELRESEDERVRKSIIHILQVGGYMSPEEKDKAFAYLEKQKEKKPAKIEQVYERFLSSDTLKSAKENKYIRAQLFWELMHNGIITAVDYQYLTDANRKPWTEEEYLKAYRKGFDVSEQLKQKEQDEKSSKPELKTPDWVYGNWDDEYMINTVIGRYSLHAEVAKKRDDTHEYNLSKSMENWLRNVVKPLILEKQNAQKSSIEEILTKAGLKPYKDGNQWCILAGDNLQEGICGFGDTIEDALYEFLIDVLDTQKKQKPVEKQDYSGLNDLERTILRGFLAAGMENVPVTIIKETAKECLAQMKPAEWSEEDEEMRSNILNALTPQLVYSVGKGTYTGTSTYKYDNEIRWLKSLHPQSKEK